MTERDFRAELDALDDSEPVSDSPASETSAPALDDGARRIIDQAVGRKAAEDAAAPETAARESLGSAALEWAKTTAVPAVKTVAEGLADTQQYIEFGKGIVPGAISMGGAALQAPDVLAAKGQQGAARFGSRILDVMDRIDRGEPVPDVEDVMGYQFMTPDQQAKARTELQQAQAAFNPTPIQDRTLFKAGESVKEYAKDLMPAAPGYEQSVGRQLGEGLGSMGAGILVAPLGTIPAGLFFAAAGAGESTARAVEYDKKERAAGRAGLTQEQIATAGILGVGPGATDLLPIEMLMGRINVPKPFQRLVATAVARIGGQAFVEGMQEGGQQFLQNLIAREVYNPSQSLSEDVLGNIGVGGGVGAIAQTGKEALTFGRRRAGRTGKAGEPGATEERTEPTFEDIAATARPVEDQPDVSPMLDGPGQKSKASLRQSGGRRASSDLDQYRDLFDAVAPPAQQTQQSLPLGEEQAQAAAPAAAEPAAPAPAKPERQGVLGQGLEQLSRPSGNREAVERLTKAVETIAPEAVPTFTELLKVLPRDERGDADLGALIPELDRLGVRAWNALNDDQRRAVYRGFAPIVQAVEQAVAPAAPAAGAESGGVQLTPERRAEIEALAAKAVRERGANVAQTQAFANEAEYGTTPQRKAEMAFYREVLERYDHETSQLKAAPAAPAASGLPSSLRTAFARTLASKATRAQWAGEIGATQEQINSLIEEALADGRLKRTAAGQIVRTAKAKEMGARPTGAEVAARPAPAVPTMDRGTERRLETVKSPLARRFAQDLVEAPDTAAVADIMDRLKAEKKGTQAALNEIVKVLTGRTGKFRQKAASYDAIAEAANRRIARRPTEIANAIANAFRDDASGVPEGSIPEGVPADGDVGRAPDAPLPDRGGRDGDVGRPASANDEQPGPAGELPGTGEDLGSDTGADQGDGERGPDTPAAPPALSDEEKAEVAAKVASDIEKAEAARRDRERLNYQITEADAIGKGGPKAKVRANIEAIRVLRKLQEEKREATLEEKQKLVKYVGWGAFSQDVFADYKPEWKAERDALKDLLSPKEYAAARASTINAHYTSPEVITAMWDALQHMGFEGGRVLEPSAGIGHFIGLMPAKLRAETAWTAVELDIISGEITKALYGAADVRVAGFETQNWPDGHFDLAISNVPFAAEGPYDPKYKQKFTLHDYFFVKALDKVRPGGIVAFITSAGTLDKAGGVARKEMDKRGTFLGAVRLPGGNQGAFKANAGTDVTTDIVFFRKKIVNEPDQNPEWRTRVEIKTPDKTAQNPKGTTDINGYFAAHPEMMLGKMRLIGSMYGKGEPVLIGPTENIGPKITAALTDAIPAGTLIPRGIAAVDMKRQDLDDTPADGTKEGAFYEKDGTLYRKVQGVGVPQKVAADAAKKVRGFIGLRKIVNDMLAKQSRGDRTGMDDLRKSLGKAYDAFVKAHGPINRTIITKQARKDGKEITVRRMPTLNLFRDDPDAFKVAAIEVYDEKTDTAKKAAIFNQDIVGAYVPPAVTGPADALAVSLNERGKVDLPLIATRLGMSEAEAIRALGDQVFEDPAGEVWRTRADYLSGDVVEKLDQARLAAELDPTRYQRNVEALEKVQPEPLTRAEIGIPFGAPWVPAEVYAEFLSEKLGARDIRLAYNEKNARWTIVGGRFPMSSDETWGTEARDAQQIVEYALNSDTIVITTEDKDGNRIRLPDQEAAARAKVDAIRDAFAGNPEAGIEGWAWMDGARASRLEQLYNHQYNRIVPQQYDGSHLTFPGLARVVTFPDGGTGTINLLPHRVNAIWRIIQQGNTLLNHAVGSGKAQPLDAKVLTPTGWKRMGDVCVGDQVIAANGLPTTVVGVFPQGQKEIFRVVFSDGSSTECCDEHLWLTQTYRERGYAQKGKKLGKDWSCARPRVRSLAEIRATLVAPHLGAKNHSIPMVAPVQLNAQPVPLSPYLVGVLIGDGSLRAREITFSTADDEILEYVRRSLPSQCEVRHRSAYDYAICYTGTVAYAERAGGGNGFRGVAHEAVRSHPVGVALDVLGLRSKYSYEKRVPAVYLNNSVEVRVDVLRGLMDTDGTVNTNGTGVSFATSSPGLADDVAYLVQSLGGTVGRSTKRIAGHRDATILSVALPPEINPFRLSRKANKVRPKSKYIPARYIVDVVPVGTKPAQCIAVSDPSHLYVTDDFIVTHNTWTSIMASMEMKRLGMIQRPMFVVPNHMLNQFSTEFYQAYPNAKLLIASKDQMSKDRRREFAAKVASDTWDGIIITHSAFTRVGMSPGAYQDYYQQEIAELVEAKDRAADEEGKDSPTVKQLEKAKKRLETKLKALTDETSKDEGVTFEELGVDFLFVDEAHMFKSLHFATRHTRVKGIANKGESKRATDLFVKMRHIEKSRPGRSAVFMTGTPVSNTMAELYTMQRYLQEPMLRKYGIAQFDSWAGTFGKIQTKSELASNSRDWVDTESFSQFVNVPELMAIVGEMMDTQTAESLKLPRPKLKGGKVEAVESELSDDEELAIQQLIEEMEKAKGKKPGEGTPFISLFTKGIQLATDMRLVDPSAPFNPDGKIGKAIGKIYDIWQEGNADPAAPNKAQIVFLDMGVPGSKGRAAPAARPGVAVDTDVAEIIRRDLLEEARGSTEDADADLEVNEDDVAAQAMLVGKFNLYQDMKDRLVERGIPAEQIAFIHEANTDDKKAKLFEKVRNGEVRILFGSTGKMGVGTNVQRQLYAMHHIDAPWKPADVEQRDGRILRQGNKNSEVRVLRYITKRSFDAYRWQLLDRKSQFIGQLFAGALGVRNAEDIDPPLPEAAELKAAATGNPLIMEHAELSREVRQLEVAERGHFRSFKQAERTAADVRARIDSARKLIEKYTPDVERIQDTSGDNFKITLTVGRQPVDLTERKKAGEALRTYLMAFAQNYWGGNRTDMELGSLGGFEMLADIRRTSDGLAVKPVLRGNERYMPNEEFLVTETSDPVQLIRRWERLPPEIRAHVEYQRTRIATNEAELPGLDAAAVVKPFTRAAELQRKATRLAALDRALKVGSTERGPEEARAEAEYASQAMTNLKATSRTAAGVVDTSASAGKAAQMAEGLTAEGAAAAATANFEAVIRDIYRRRDQIALLKPEALGKEADKIALAINKGILREGALYREDDSAKFPYTAVADLPLAYRQFYEELSKRLEDPNADPVETAAFIEWRANLADHFWADGVGKTSKALAALPLMRAGLPLPVYRSNKEFFSYSQKDRIDPKDGPEAYLGADWQRFLAYYRTLMPKVVTSDPVLDAPNFGLPEPPRTLPDDHPLLKPHWGDDPAQQDNSPERIAMRQRLIDQRFVGKLPAPADRKPIALLMGGGGASGKGTVLKILHQNGFIDDNFVELDPDSFKTGAVDKEALKKTGVRTFLMDGLPEYWQIVDAGDSRAAGATHEESSYTYKEAQKRGMAGRYDLVLDQTMGDPAKGAKLIENLKAAGYEVRLVGVTVDPDVAVQRAVERAQGPEKRYVPLDALLKAHKGFTKGFEGYADAVDMAMLADTNGPKTQQNFNLSANKPQGSELEVLDQSSYLNFGRKGQIDEKATTLRQLLTSIGKKAGAELGRDGQVPEGGNSGTVGEGGEGAERRFDRQRPGRLDGLSGWRLSEKGRVTPALSDSQAGQRRALSGIAGLLRMGRPVAISPEVSEAFLEAARPLSPMLPKGSSVGALTGLQPSVVHSSEAIASFRLLDGSLLEIPIEIDWLARYRAVYDRRSGHVLLLGKSPAELVGDLGELVATRVQHEAVHARWRSLPADVRSRLVSHAETLGVLDMQLGTVLQAVGEPVGPDPRNLMTLRKLYTEMYARTPDLQDRLDQEAVAHLRELQRAGFFFESDLAPIRDDLALLDGEMVPSDPAERDSVLSAALSSEGALSGRETATLADHFGATRIEDIGPGDPHPGRVLAFHGTPNPLDGPMNSRHSSDFGIHFGTAEQANAAAKGNKFAQNQRPNLIPVILDVRRVLTLPDIPTWYPANIAAELERRAPKGFAGFAATIANMDVDQAYGVIKERFRQLGIDAIRYQNAHEGSGWSYIVWEPGHVISATAGDQLFAIGGGASLRERLAAIDTPEVRKQRAAALGFDTSRVLYHGTRNVFESFDLGKAKWEPGVFLTTEPKVASSYAGYHYDLFPEMKRSALTDPVDGGSVIPAYIRGRLKEVDLAGVTGGLKRRDAIEQAQQEGYDGVVLKNHKDAGDTSDQYVIFDPKNIRSVNADFDPAQSGSSQLMAALGGGFGFEDSPEAQKARAKEMGFDTSTVYYHGTAADKLDAFDPSRAGTVQYSDWGPGIYLTPSKSGADHYRTEALKKVNDAYNAAYARYEALARNTPVKNGAPQYSDEANAALKEFQRIGREMNRASGGQIVEAYVRMERPYILEYQSMPDPTVAERAKERGHDGIKVLNPDGSVNEIVVFDPSNIRRINAAFDPSQSNSANLMAALGSSPEPDGQANLNSVINKLSNALGIVPTQTLQGVTITGETAEGGEASIRLNPRGNVRGQTVSATGAIGVRKSRDIAAIAHEGAHFMETVIGAPILDLQDQFAQTLEYNFTRAGQPFVKGEAFAEWFRSYILNPEGTRQIDPALVEQFEDVVEASYPEMLEGLHEAQAEYQQWQARATPEELSSDLVSTYAENSWSDLRSDEAFENIAGKMATAYTATVDDLNPLQHMTRKLLEVADRNGVRDAEGRPISLSVGENPYKRARMFRGSFATGYAWLKSGIAFAGQGSPSVPGLAKALETLFGSDNAKDWDRSKYQAAGQYLVSVRALAEYDLLDQKEARLGEIDGLIQEGGEAWRTISLEGQKARAILDRRQVALTRGETLLRDRRRALKAAEKDLTAIQEKLQAKRDDILAAQMARDPALAQRRRGELAVMERQSQQALREVSRLVTDYDSLSTDVAMLSNEIEQLRARAGSLEGQLAGLDQAMTELRKERERTANRGANRKPTAESREWHEAFIRKIEADPKYAKIQEFADMVHQFAHGMLRLELEAGFLNQAQFDELSKRKDFYVPFARDMTDAPAGDVFFRGGKTWSPFKRFDGSDRAILNPLETIAQDAYALAAKIARNQATDALARLAERAGPGSASIAQVLTREESMEANAATFDRIQQIAINMGIDEVDARRIASQLEEDFTDNQMLQAIWSPGSKGPVNLPTVPLWRNGERIMVRFTDPEFGVDAFNGFSGLGKETMGIVGEFLSTPARLLQVGVTTHPTFMPRNLFRDIKDAWIKTGALPVITQVRGAKILKSNPEFVRQYAEAGGITGGRNIASLTAKEQQVDLIGGPNALARVIEAASGGKIKATESDSAFLRREGMADKRLSPGSIVLGSIAGGLLGTVAGGPLAAVPAAVFGAWLFNKVGALKAVESVETMTRMGVAAHAYKRALAHNPDLTETQAMLEAAFVARDVFDWNRRGSRMLAIVRNITFLNAQIQGLDAAVRRLGGESDRGSTLSRHMGMVWRRETGGVLSKDEERALGDAYKTWARMAIYTGFLLSLYALATGGDDERDKAYQDIRDKTKSTHSWLPNIFGVDVRLPKAFEWAVPANTIEAIADKIRGRDPRAWDRIVDSAYEVLVPPGVPQALNLVVGLTANVQIDELAPWMKRLLGRDAENKSPRQIVGEQLARLDPEAQFDAFSSQLSIDVAKALAKAGVPRDMIPSPKKIDFILRSGGYWGHDIGKGYGVIREALGGRPREAVRISDLPIIAGFTGVAARQSRSRDELFQQMAQSGGQMTTAANTYKNYLDNEGTPGEATRFISGLEPDERVYALLKYHGSPNDAKMHPLERLLAVDGVAGRIRKDIILDRLTPVRKEGRKTRRDWEEKVTLSPRKQTEVHEILERLQQAEAWNTMVLMRRKGWENGKEIAVQPILDELKASSPQVFELYEDRVSKAKVRDFSDVKENWPERRQEILREGVDAF